MSKDPDEEKYATLDQLGEELEKIPGMSEEVERAERPAWQVYGQAAVIILGVLIFLLLLFSVSMNNFDHRVPVFPHAADDQWR